MIKNGRIVPFFLSLTAGALLIFIISHFLFSEEWQEFSRLLFILLMAITTVLYQPWKTWKEKRCEISTYKEMPIVRLIISVAILLLLFLARFLILKNVYKSGFHYLFVRNLSFTNVFGCLVIALIEELFYKGTVLGYFKDRTGIPTLVLLFVISFLYAATWAPRQVVIVAYAFIIQLASLGAFLIYPSFIPVVAWNLLMALLSGS